MQFKISFRAMLTALSLLAVSAGATAKLVDMKLSELVALSEVIVYGRVTSPDKGAEGTITFVAERVLKGAAVHKGMSVAICNAVDDSESLDLRAVHKRLVVFAKPDGPCFRPVHGISSTIIVSKGVAATAAIVDQPSQQPLSDFLEKIRRSEAGAQ
jgi:hypothetical protein